MEAEIIEAFTKVVNIDKALLDLINSSGQDIQLLFILVGVLGAGIVLLLIWNIILTKKISGIKKAKKFEVVKDDKFVND